MLVAWLDPNVRLCCCMCIYPRPQFWLTAAVPIADCISAETEQAAYIRHASGWSGRVCAQRSQRGGVDRARRVCIFGLEAARYVA